MSNSETLKADITLSKGVFSNACGVLCDTLASLTGLASQAACGGSFLESVSPSPIAVISINKENNISRYLGSLRI